MVLPVVNAALEQIFDSDFLDAVHGVGLPRPRLSIRKNCDDALVEDQIQNRPHLEKVELFVGRCFAKGVVELEFLIVDSFCDSVDFVLALVDSDAWVVD